MRKYLFLLVMYGCTASNASQKLVEMKCEETEEKHLYRCSNNEVVCYEYSIFAMNGVGATLQCKFIK